jgi:hypothetical protein
MKILIRLGLIIMAPYLLVQYWKNSLKEIGDINSCYGPKSNLEYD